LYFGRDVRNFSLGIFGLRLAKVWNRTRAWVTFHLAPACLCAGAVPLKAWTASGATVRRHNTGSDCFFRERETAPGIALIGRKNGMAENVQEN
jgi:hypothetical protein